MKTMWGMMVILSTNQWPPFDEKMVFDEEVWDLILKRCSETGVNTILLDVGDAVQYDSHPEISIPGAWSKERVHVEVKRCRDLGIALIPKLNFSTCHNLWMHDYYYMVSSQPYYKVCSDLIKEIYEMFEAPEYIHLGMDEEGYNTVGQFYEYVCYRTKSALVKDLKFLFNEVKKTGAKPWIWADVLLKHPDLYMENFTPDDALLSPWYYSAYKREHSTPLQVWCDIYQGGKDCRETENYKKGYRYFEDLPENVEFRENAHKYMEKGYKYVPCCSTFDGNDYNTEELLEHFLNNAPSDNPIVGYMSAPWVRTEKSSIPAYEKSFRLLKEAKDKFNM